MIDFVDFFAEVEYTLQGRVETERVCSSCRIWGRILRKNVRDICLGDRIERSRRYRSASSSALIGGVESHADRNPKIAAEHRWDGYLGMTNDIGNVAANFF